MVEELETHAAETPCVGGGSDGRCAGIDCRVGVFGCAADCGAEDVKQRGDGISALVPKQRSGFLRAQQGGVGLASDVLKARVGGFGQGGEVGVEFGDGVIRFGGRFRGLGYRS